ncbi:hypothetical protein BJX96DRAFT_11933 [Aspergillus floccosus]
MIDSRPQIQIQIQIHPCPLHSPTGSTGCFSSWRSGHPVPAGPVWLALSGAAVRQSTRRTLPSSANAIFR